MTKDEQEKPLDIDKNAKVGDFAKKKGEIVIREHSFDGIQEYDQRLPNWWLTVLWASIVLFVGYYAIYYSFDLLPTSTKQMDQREEEIYAMRQAAIQKTLDSLSNEVLMKSWVASPDILDQGATVYAQHCVGCHGADYKSNNGATARSLVDGQWEYGNTPMDVFNIILEGTPADSQGYNGGMKMLPWKTQLSSEQIAQVTAFVISLNKDEFKEYEK